ncbi:hypothetical protein F4778DRAFT_523024 [Xylariomycetidae sp. FL2044]|nr:hypothetical protein F4778DRAFT_523024 [Xylariomycetidae sp. FL2044]
MQVLRVILLAAATASALPRNPTSSRRSGPLSIRQEEEEEEENKVKSTGEFDTEIAVEGGDLLQAVAMPPNDVGAFEVEFADVDANSFTVTENTAPAAPPAGFTLADASSYIVQFTGSVDAITQGQIDYIGNADVDITNNQIGRLCTETNTFVVLDETLAEREFEADENELAVKLANTALLNGEFALLTPDASAADDAANDTADDAADDAADTGSGNSLADLLSALFGGGASAGAEDDAAASTGSLSDLLTGLLGGGATAA